MKNKYKASAVFNKLYEAVQPKGDIPVDIPSHIGYRLGKSRQTVRQYTCKPDSSGFRIPPLSVIDKLFQCVMHEDVHRAASLRGLTLSDGYRVHQIILSDYEAALDLADAIRIPLVPQGDAVVPALSDAARLRHQWRQVYFSGSVDRADLAIIAGVDVYDVGFVGREHPTLGIQPSAEMVAKAMALEALSGRERSGMSKSNDFIAAKLAPKKTETVTVKPTVPFKRTWPAPYESRVVILRRRADGTVEEKNAAPAFLRQDRKSLVERVILPADYYWRGSPEHLARREEMEKEKGA